MDIHHEKILLEYNVRIMTDFSRSVPHWHQHGEMLYVLTGELLITIGSQQYTGLPGDTFVISSGQIHDIQPRMLESSLYVTTYNPSLLTTLSQELRFVRSYISAALLQKANQDQKIRSLFSDCLKERHSDETWSGVMVQTGLLQIYTILLRHFETDQKDYYNQNKFADFQAVLTYLYTNYADDITLLDIARQLNYSMSYVSTIFSQYAGINFKQYLGNIRVNKAADMLLNSSRSVSEIAMLCGFSTLRTFNNTFRRITGITPSAYRKK